MTRNHRLDLIVQRLRHCGREVAVAVALTVVAAAFLVTTLMEQRPSSGPPMAAVQRLP